MVSGKQGYTILPCIVVECQKGMLESYVQVLAQAVMSISPKLHGLWNPDVQFHIHKGPPIIPTLSRINLIPRMMHISLRSILIFPCHLCLGLPKWIFLVGLPVKILRAFLLFSILVTWPSHLSFLDLIALTILNYEVPQCGTFSTHFSHFSITLNLDSSLNARDHVSQPCNTNVNIFIKYV